MRHHLDCFVSNLVKLETKLQSSIPAIAAWSQPGSHPFFCPRRPVTAGRCSHIDGTRELLHLVEPQSNSVPEYPHPISIVASNMLTYTFPQDFHTEVVCNHDNH